MLRGVSSASFNGSAGSNGSGSFTGLQLYSNDAGAAVGPSFDNYRDSASPAAADILGSYDFNGDSSTGVKRLYAGIQGRIASPTNAAESGALDINMIVNGTARTPWKFASTGANPISTMTWGTTTTVTMQFDQAVTDGFQMSLSSTSAAAGYIFRNASNIIGRFGNLLSGHGQLQLVPGLATPAGGLAGSGITFGSTANLGIFFGSGAPSLAAAQGSLYIRSDGSGIADRLYVNTNGSTTWTNFVSAA
jgi:hypothetical protein